MPVALTSRERAGISIDIAELRAEDRYHAIKSEWEDFHKNNPHIYPLFDKSVRAEITYLKGKNLLYVRKAQLRYIFESLKREGVSTDCPKGYSINNDFYKMYAFQWESNNPHYMGIFEHRGYVPPAIWKLHHEAEAKILIAKKRLQRSIKKHSEATPISKL